MFFKKNTPYFSHAAESASETAAQPENNSAPTLTPEQVAELQAKLSETQAKLAETHDRMLRIAADAENTRKRLEKEKIDTRIYSIQEFAKDLLPIMDAFEKALTTVEQAQINPENEDDKKISSIVEGVQLVSKVFQDTTKKHGIERLPGKGAPFNPMYHNAITKVVDANLTQETVIDEFMPGYKIGDRILRTAMVRVGAPD